MASRKQQPRYMQHILTLPPEVVYPIISNLALGRVLRMALYNNAYIDNCILSHLHYQHIFRTPQALADTTSRLALYELLRQETNSHSLHMLSLDIHTLDRGPVSAENGPDIYQQITDCLNRQIVRWLALAQPQLEKLSLVVPKELDLDLSPLQDPVSDIQRLEEHWKDLCTAQHILNRHHVRQVREVIELLKRYPAMFKSPFSTQETQPRFAAHMCAELKVIKKRLMRESPLTSRCAGYYIFKYRDVLPVVPYDYFLRLLLKTLKNRPLAGAEQYETKITTLTKRQQRAREKEEHQKRKKEGYAYPQAIAGDIRTVLAGMAYVYSTPTLYVAPEERIARTKYTPYSAPPFNYACGLNQPCFVTDPYWPVDNYCLPRADEERGWLPAFARVCSFMEGMAKDRVAVVAA